MKVVGGPSSAELARKVAEALKLPLVSIRTKRFPDGEFYFKFDENILGEDLLIVQSVYPPQDIHVMELFFMLHTIRELKAKTTKAFVPYLAYSRQDERYLEGECLSSAMIAEILEQLGTDAVYTVDIHNERVLEMYKIPVYNLTASREIAKYFAAKRLKDPIIISPDDEELAVKRAKIVASTINAECDFLKKSRDRYTGEVVTYTKIMDVQGRDAIIIDDIISTGKTAANATRILKKQGARRVYVGVTHALLLGDSLPLLKESGVYELVGTDSIVNDCAKVSVAPILAETLSKSRD